MTEQQAAPQGQVVDQSAQIKFSLINYANKLYQEFLQAISNIPREPEHSRQAFIRFEEGAFWLTNSINKASLQIAPMTPIAPPSAPPSNDVPVAPDLAVAPEDQAIAGEPEAPSEPTPEPDLTPAA